MPAGDVAPAIAQETLAACPLCGCTRARDWIEGFDRQHGVDRVRFTYRTCEECGLVYLSPRPTAAAIAAYYPTDYGPYHAPAGGAAGVEEPASAAPADPERAWSQPPAWLRRVVLPLAEGMNYVGRRLLRDRFDHRFKRFYEPWRRDLTLLDFGCGSDKFLNQSRKRGFARTIGVDFAPDVVARVRASGHEGYLADETAWQAIAPGSVHLIRMNHVLEHLFEPKAVLARLIERLAPDGRMHVALPNPRSFTASFFRSRWFGLECPRHVMLYSAGRARRLLAELGLSNSTVLHETVTKDIARSLAYVYVDRGELGPGQVDALIHDRFLKALAWLPARISALVGRSDRFHLLARR